MSSTQLRTALWAIIGAAVVLFTFFALIGGISPGQATVLTMVIAVLAVAWLAHTIRRARTTDVGRVMRADRERRGF